MLDENTMERIRALERQVAKMAKTIEELYQRPYPHPTKPNTIVTNTLFKMPEPEKKES